MATITTSRRTNRQTSNPLLFFFFRYAASQNKGSSLLLMPQFVWVFFTLTQATPAPSPLLPAYFGVVFLVCSWKGPQRQDNRAPARIMSPQREMQLGPRVIQERWWWPRFKVVRDDPQPHLISPWLEFPLWHSHTQSTHAHTQAHTLVLHKEITQEINTHIFIFSLCHVCHKGVFVSVFPSECVSRFIHTITASLSVSWLSHTLRHLNVDRNYAPRKQKPDCLHTGSTFNSQEHTGH